MERISIIIPCYNEQEAIPIYYEEMKKIMADMKEVGFELIFVDDGSGDHTLEQMRSLAEKDARCRYLSFSRNFGKEAALYAGLSHASGDYVAVMDADLQDPPELLPRMYELLSTEECDCAAARRADRDGEPLLRSFFSDCFYKVMGKLSRTGIVKGARDYRMMKRKMVDAILSMSEYNRFSKGIFQWIGFRTIWLEFFQYKALRRADKMVHEKADSLFSGGNYRLLNSSSVPCLCLWRNILLPLPFSGSAGAWRKPVLWTACDRLDFSGMYSLFAKQRAAFMHRNPGSISFQNLSGNKAQTHLHTKGEQPGKKAGKAAPALHCKAGKNASEQHGRVKNGYYLQ